MKSYSKLKLKYHNFKLKHTKTMQEEYELLYKYGYITKDCEPIRCVKCGSTNLKETNREVGGYNIPEGMVCEYEVVCADCGQSCGHWAYGGWSL